MLPVDGHAVGREAPSPLLPSSPSCSAGSRSGKAAVTSHPAHAPPISDSGSGLPERPPNPSPAAILGSHGVPATQESWTASTKYPPSLPALPHSCHSSRSAPSPPLHTLTSPLASACSPGPTLHALTLVVLDFPCPQGPHPWAPPPTCHTPGPQRLSSAGKSPQAQEVCCLHQFPASSCI